MRPKRHNTSLDNLLYRRQFVLCNFPLLDLPEWKSFSFGPFYLNVHPDLETTITKGCNGDFLLLGFALNHHRPVANNQELMDEMAGTCHNIEDVFEYCRDLCGRYIIIFNFAGKTGLLNDLIGCRTVYYCFHQNSVLCASQPGTLARLIRIEEDPSSIVRAYVERDMFASGEGCWIGDGTKYAGVKHLLPNHYLDFEEKKAVRYWPIATLEPVDIEDASRQSAEMLENTMLAATNRFQLSMAITSGWDSRCMLAATRNVHSKIFYYIQKYRGMTDSHPDIRVPRKLTRKLGIPYHIIECGDYQDEAFDITLERNVFLVHNPAKKVLLRSFYQDFQGKVNASGNISDLCRTVYGINPIHEITDLLELVYLSDSKYAAEAIKEWYVYAKSRCDTFGYNLRDLFFWEQVLGNWGSMFAAELDIAIDEFYPFGTRRLVETILAVDGKLRPYHNSMVHRRIIELAWPELLAEPINPSGWHTTTIKFLHDKGKRIMKRLGLLPFVRTLCSKLVG